MQFGDLFTNPDAAQDVYAQALAKGVVKEHILELKSPGGDFIYIQCSAERTGSSVLVTGRNITDRKSLQASQVESEEKFRVAFDFASIGMALVDLQGRIIEANNSLCKLLGFDKGQLEGADVREIALLESDIHQVGDKPKAGQDFEVFQRVTEKCFTTEEKQEQWVEISFVQILGRNGKPTHFIASFRDISERKYLQTLLQEMSSVDPLTKALPRKQFERRAEIEMKRATRHKRTASLILLDLDFFRLVNDKFGDTVGDKVLGEFGEVVRNSLRLHDLFGRWQGTEFAIFLPEAPLEGAAAVAERLRDKIGSFVFTEGVQLTASLGTVSARPDENFNSLMSRANDGVFRAKQAGRNQVSGDKKAVVKEEPKQPEPPRRFELLWKSAYESGFRELDAEHQSVFEYINHMLRVIPPTATGSELMPLVNGLLDELEAHFAHEEAWLESALYPGLEAHRESHQSLLDLADALAERIHRKEIKASDFMDCIVQDFVARHILQEDREFFPWLASEQAGEGETMDPTPDPSPRGGRIAAA